MLIALDSDNRASLRRLFDRYPCLHGNVAAVIEGGMGKVFADSQQEPHVALAVLDFHFLAGDPLCGWTRARPVVPRCCIHYLSNPQ